MTKTEAYEHIDMHKKSLENPDEFYMPLYTIKYITSSYLDEKGWNKVKESWGDEW